MHDACLCSCWWPLGANPRGKEGKGLENLGPLKYSESRLQLAGGRSQVPISAAVAVVMNMVGDWLLREQHDTAAVLAAVVVVGYLSHVARTMLAT